MKILKYILISLALIIGITQCKLPDNVNPKRATEVPVSTLFTNAVRAMFYQVDECNVNVNINKLMVQFWQETTYFDEARYNFIDRQIPDGYVIEFYRDALMDFRRAKELLSEDDGGDPEGRDRMVAVIDILFAYGMLTTVDAFGDLPYTEAFQLNENILPVYDDAKSIYLAEIASLKAAIALLGSNSGPTFGGADIMYGGDTDLWRKFGASFLLRCGMRLADVDAAAAQDAYNAAMAAGVFTDQAEAGFLHFNGVVPNVNPTYDAFIVDGRSDFLPTNTIIDIMAGNEGANHDLGIQDPRLDKYFTEHPENGWVGAVAGLDGAQTYANFSHFAPVFFEATFPAMIIDYIEVEFLLAEAAERGFGGDAATHYNNAVTASILYWGGTEQEAADYLAASGVAYDAAIWKERIGVQKWIALYNRSCEAWAEWRRLDYPMLNVPEDMVYGDIPLRMPYPYNEPLQNRDNYEAAAAKIGGDDQRTPLFWDVVPSPFK